jgi:hypothetical protein
MSKLCAHLCRRATHHCNRSSRTEEAEARRNKRKACLHSGPTMNFNGQGERHASEAVHKQAKARSLSFPSHTLHHTPVQKATRVGVEGFGVGANPHKWPRARYEESHSTTIRFVLLPKCMSQASNGCSWTCPSATINLLHGHSTHVRTQWFGVSGMPSRM